MLYSNRKKDLVSVAIPSYNYGHYLFDVLNGLNKQTYQEIEVIVLDDCSTDNTGEVVESWKKENSYVFKNLIYLRLPRRIPPEWVLNIGFIVSHGEYMVIHDADDISHREKIEKQLMWLKNHPETAVVGTKYHDFIENKNRIIGNSVWVCTNRSEIVTMYQETTYHCVCFGTLMFRVNILKELLACKKITGGFGDYDFIRRIVNSNYVIDNLDEYLFFVRNHSEQSTKNTTINTKVVNSLTERKNNCRSISIILPTQGTVEKTIDALIEIFQRSNYSSYSKVEVIIVDGKGINNLEEKIYSWNGKYKNFKISDIRKEIVYIRIPGEVDYSSLYIIGLFLTKEDNVLLYSKSEDNIKPLLDISREFAEKAGINKPIKDFVEFQ